MEYIKVHTDSAIIIQKLQLLMNEAQIPNIVKNKENAALMAGFGFIPGSVSIWVAASKVEEAKEIIENDLNI